MGLSIFFLECLITLDVLFIRERARQTAARECYEETLGILGSALVLQQQLEDYKTNNVFKVV